MVSAVFSVLASLPVLPCLWGSLAQIRHKKNPSSNQMEGLLFGDSLVYLAPRIGAPKRSFVG
jgi:hypothetical protein